MGTKTNAIRWSHINTFKSTFDDGAGLVQVQSTRPYYSSVFTDTRVGTNQPKWRAIIKSGSNATTPMSGTRGRRLEYSEYSITNGFRAVPPSNLSSYIEQCKGNVSHADFIPAHSPNTSKTAADNLAIIQALKRVQQSRTHFQGLTFLGELGETIRMLKRPFAGVRKHIDLYFTDLRKMQKSRPGRGSRIIRRDSFLKTASGAWLETVFGVKPLLNDTRDLAEAIARFSNDSRRSIVIGNGEDRRATDLAFTDTVGNYTHLSIHWIDTTIRSVRYKVYLDHSRSAEMGSLGRLTDLLGFRLENFVPTIWELVPWSFLIDYVSNIGDVIQAGCTSQSDVKFVVRTDRLQTIRQADVTPYLNPAVANQAKFYTLDASPGAFVTTRTDIERSTLSSIGVPSVSFNLPGKGMQYANILALWGANERSIVSRVRF